MNSTNVEADLSLYARLASRDESALGEFFDQRCDDVNTLVTRIVGDECDTDRIVEEVFWKAWLQAGESQSTGCSDPAWLITIAQAEAHSALRLSRRGRDRVANVRRDVDKTSSVSTSASRFA